MRVVRPDFVEAISKAANTALMQGFAHAEVQWNKIAMLVKSDGPSETYPWLGESHKPREWTDQRVPYDLSEYSFTLTNKKYESTMQVEKEALEDDRFGQIVPRAMSMGEAARQYIDELAFTALNDGFSTACYDDQYFFSASHSEKDSGTQSNLGSVALSGDNVTKGIAEMRQFKDDQGRYLDIVPDTMIVHPDEEGQAMEIILSDRDPDNANNPVNVNKGRFKLVVTPFLTSGYWILARTSGAMKPAMWQERVPITMQTDDSHLFDEDYLQFGVRFRGIAGLTNWRLAYGSHV
jgi:phage major head subunit gpT-like protein